MVSKTLTLTLTLTPKQVCLVGSKGERVSAVVSQPKSETVSSTVADTLPTGTTTLPTTTVPNPQSTTSILHRVSCEFGEHGGVDGEGSVLIQCSAAVGCECVQPPSAATACTYDRLGGGFY